MRSLRLLLTFTLLLTFSNSGLFSQINNAPVVADVHSLDSLQGFDQNMANQQALGEGFFGQAYTNAIKIYKRNFVINKYDLYNTLNNPAPSSGGNGKYSSGIIANAPCSNEDFEVGNLSGWTASVGVNGNSQNYPTVTGPASASQASVMTTNITDPYVGTIPASPLGGTKVVRINNDVAGDFSVVKLSQTFPVTATNYFFDFAYWAVMEDAGSAGVAHSCSNTPFMLIKIRDNSNILQALCPTFSIVAPASGSGGCAGLGPLTWTTVGSGVNAIKTSTGWQKFSIDLTPYLFSTPGNVTIEVFVGDCSLGGHWGYAYFDARCNTMDLSVNTQTLSLLSPTVYPQVLCGGTATMTAPAGLINYTWTGPPSAGIGTVTTQTLVTAVPGNYTLVMNPPGICNPISKIVNLQFVPPTTVTASPANLCATGTNTSSTLSASGASQYTWMPGGSNSSSIVVTPTITTVYTLTARTGTCTGTYTIQVSVNPDPSLSLLTSNTSVCPGQTFTMTATGANSYLWNPGALTGSLVTLTQSTANTYTVAGTSTAGCVSTSTIAIGITPSPTVVITAFSPTYNCSGSPVTLVATGASVVWQPGGSTSGVVVFNPTVTTTYTAFGSSGSCTALATIVLSVNPGPSITITPNPTLVCPGNSTTLTAVAPAAVGVFTWSPGGSNATSIVVTPTLAGGYSVSAVDAMGCRSTYTANPNVGPLPNITISPTTPSVCFGSSVTLTGGGGVTYTWQPGNLNGSSISVSPTVNTTYTLTGATAAGCVNQATVTVTVTPLPVITAVANPTAVCSGNCSTITPGGAGVGGTYSITGASNFTVCPLANTTYTVRGTNAAGCIGNQVTVAVNVNSSPSLTLTANPTTICAGASSTLNVSGATTYTWANTGTNGSSLVVTPSVTTIYTVTGTNASGCTSTRTVQVLVNPVPSISVTPSSPSICIGSNTTLIASGAAAYTWQPGGSTSASLLVAPVVNTTYTVTGASSGCSSQRTVAVTVLLLPVITASYSPSNTICAGSCASLSTSGAITYTVNGLSAVACPTITSNYTVVGTGANGCTSAPVTGTLFVTNGPTLIASANPTAICPGGSSTLSATGGISYTWQPGGLSGSPVVVSPTITTTYTLTGNNASGCTSTRTVTVLVNPTPTITATASPTAICSGGTATLSALGAGNYFWTPGALSGTNVFVSPTVTTVYTVTGNSGGCSSFTFVTLVVNPAPTVSITATPTSVCQGGSATLTASGAGTYTWSTSSTATSIVVTPSITTTYSLRGTSALGCAASNTAVTTIIVNPAPNLSLTASPSTICAGSSSTLSASGAVAYTWQPGNLSGASVVVTPSVTTIYSVTGVNASGCSATRTIAVTVNPAITLFANASPTTICAGGSSTLTGGGATSYTWLPGSVVGNPITVTPAASTVYTLTGSSLGCTAQTTIAVNVSPAPSVSISATPTQVCAGSCATLTASGATSYTWSVGSTGASIVVCPTVSTSYSVIGSNGFCTGFATRFITVNSLPVVSASATPNTICPGNSATLSAIGASSYTWQPGNLSGSSVVVTPTSSTNYTVFGSNAAGCIDTATAFVTVNPSPSVSASASPSAICQGQSTNLSAIGATNYTWNPGGLTGANVTVSPGVPTLYTVIGESAGCTSTANVVVIVNPAPGITINSSTTSVCLGASVTFTASGGTTYTWSPGSLTNNPLTVTPAVSTVYTVNSTNVSGCGGSQTVAVTVNPVPSLTISASANPVCSGSPVTLNVSGASSYTWSNGAPFASIVVNPSVTTTYSVIGSSGSGCNGTANITVTVNPSPAVSISASSPTVCAGFTVGLLGVGAPSFTWFPGSITGNPIVVTPSATTVYTAVGSNGNCNSSTTVTITVIPLPSVSVTASSSLICTGSSVTLTASGAVTYSWIPSLSGGSTFIDTPTALTVYTVVGLAASGCPNFATVSVNVLPAPVVSAISTSSAICIGSSATLTATGATNYTWTPGSQLGASISVSPTSNTTYTVTGDNGTCSSSTVISIAVNALPTVTASAVNSPLCAGSSVTLTAGGAVNYTWSPIGSNGSVTTDTPLVSTTYSVTGEDSNGCLNTANVSVVVNTNPLIVAVPQFTTICEGSSVSLSAINGLTYTWTPNGQTGSTITVTPSVTTNYTVIGTDSNGCSGLDVAVVNIVPNPTITITPVNSSVCIGSQATLTASGATNYTWLPSGGNSSITIETPLVNSTYTVIGDNAGLCATSATVAVFVNPLPANVTASSTGTVSCASPTISLSGNCSDPNVSYGWSGPSGYSSSVQNPIVSGIWGIFTLSVTDNVTGCVATATVNVPTDNSIPSVTATASGSITCSFSVVTLNAANTTTNPGYSWAGPGSFTSTAQTVTVTQAGDYTVTVTDLSSTCSSTALVSVGTHTNVYVTASITPATCSGGSSNNDGKITVANFGVADKYDLVIGSTYTGTATYANAAIIPSSSVITSNLANPTTTLAYTIRLFDSEGCVKDTTLFLVPVDCSLKTLGIAKAVSSPTLNTDGSYDLMYTVVVKNYDLGALKKISLTENLSNTFPNATTFTVTGAPVVSPVSSALTINNSFDGITQTNLLSGTTSSLAGGLADTIRFTVKVKTSLFFVPFNNTVLGSAFNGEGKEISDSSNTGLDPDPDNDINPYNNNIPTSIIFIPNNFFGITKVGEINRSDNDSYDVSYTVTIHNLGNDTVRNVSLNDSLFAKTIQNPATYSMRSGPVVSGSGIVANSSFNGNTDIRLILPSQSMMYPNTTSSVRFVINVVPGEISSISNSAYGSGLSRLDATTSITVSDTSNAGNNPDVNGNGIWNEPSDNVPTVLLVPSTNTLFIPEGFSPNGDNVNQYFTIEGLPTTGENSLTIFNRWGNKVYFNSNYDNSWDGTPNVSGTLGKDKLPQGTYFYILDMKGSGIKPISGFVVLAY